MQLKDLLSLIKYGGENIVIYSDEYCNRKFKVDDIPNHLYNRYVEELGTTHGGDIIVSLYDEDYVFDKYKDALNLLSEKIKGNNKI